MNEFEIRNVKIDEFDSAISLVLKVFMEFEAPEYSDEGVETFRSFVLSEEYRQEFIEGQRLFLGCFYKNILVGIIAMRDISHICLLFVDKNFHRRGIATSLFYRVLEILKEANEEIEEITVNSSPYGAGFYHSVGFVDKEGVQTRDGITYLPMVYRI